jgi:hypothetical protein
MLLYLTKVSKRHRMSAITHVHSQPSLDTNRTGKSLFPVDNHTMNPLETVLSWKRFLKCFKADGGEITVLRVHDKLKKVERGARNTTWHQPCPSLQTFVPGCDYHAGVFIMQGCLKLGAFYGLDTSTRSAPHVYCTEYSVGQRVGGARDFLRHDSLWALVRIGHPNSPRHLASPRKRSTF